MDITVVIPTHNRNDLLARTLASLGECRLPASYARTIVAENGGRFGAENVVRAALPTLRCEYMYLAQGNKSAALNDVLDRAGEGLLVFLDDDIRLARDAMVAFERAALEHPQRVFFGGPMEVDYETPPPSWILPFMAASVKGWSHGSDDGFLDKPLLMGCNWAAFVTDLRAAGGFNADKGPGSALNATGQERDMMRRLMAHGVRCRYVAAGKVWHYVPANRCSPEWLVDRKFRNGVETGLAVSGESTCVFGVPRWMLVQAVKSYMNWLVCKLRRDPQARFRALLQWNEMKGRLVGARSSTTHATPAVTHA